MTETPVTSLGLRNVLKRVLASPYQLAETTYRPVQLTTVEGRLLNLQVLQFNTNMLQVSVSVPDDQHFAHALAEVMLPRFSGPILTAISLGIINKNLCWAGTEEDAVSDLTKLLQAMLQSQMCACRQHLIVDNQNCCFTCDLNLTPEGLSQHTCPVCLERCVAPVQKLECCGNWIHVACLKKHVYTSQNKGCPLCRGAHHTEQYEDHEREAEINFQYLAALPDIGVILARS